MDKINLGKVSVFYDGSYSRVARSHYLSLAQLSRCTLIVQLAFDLFKD